jgi:hypothetical protein
MLPDIRPEDVVWYYGEETGTWYVDDGMVVTEHESELAAQRAYNAARRQIEALQQVLSRMPGAMQEWSEMAAQAASLGEQIVTIMAKMQRLYNANDLGARIEATPPGAVVPGGVLSREACLEAQQMIVSFLAWVTTPVQQGGRTPEVIISQRLW